MFSFNKKKLNAFAFFSLCVFVIFINSQNCAKKNFYFVDQNSKFQSDDINNPAIVSTQDPLLNPPMELNVELDLDASRIQILPNQAPAIADGKFKVLFTVYLISKESQFVSGVIPSLLITGSGSNKYSCDKTDNFGLAQCQLSSTASGTKILNLNIKNVVFKNMASVIFYEPPSIASALIITNNAFANGNSQNIIDVTWLDFYGNPRYGSVPQLTVSDVDLVDGTTLVQCLPVLASGVARCMITSSRAGDKQIHFLDPLLPDMKLTFIKSIYSYDSLRGYTSNDGSEYILFHVNLVDSSGNPQVGIPVQLTYSPSSDGYKSFTCTSTSSSGAADCKVSSSVPGLKVVGVKTPTGITESLQLLFASPGSKITPSPSNPYINGKLPPADGVTPFGISVTLVDGTGKPIVGVIPKGHVEDSSSGTNTLICYASDAAGIAECTVTATTPGPKLVFIDGPPVKDPLVVTFKNSPIVVLTNFVPADGNTPVVIKINSEVQEGFTPVLFFKTKSDKNNTIGNSPSGFGASSVDVAANDVNFECTVLQKNKLNAITSTCLITEHQSGMIYVGIKLPTELSDSPLVPITFTDAYSTMALLKSSAKADNIDSIKVQINIKDAKNLAISEFLPELQVSGNGMPPASVSCTNSDAKGSAICNITSAFDGSKVITASKPFIVSNLVALFYSLNTSIDLSSSVLNAVVDPNSAAIINIIIKDSLGNIEAGVIPTLVLTGGGTYKCYPSESNTGISKCEIRSTVVQDVVVNVVSPFIVNPVTTHFTSNIQSCLASTFANSKTVEKVWVGPAVTDFGACVLKECLVNYDVSSDKTRCVPQQRQCSPMPVGGLAGTQTWESSTAGAWGTCVLTSCQTPHYSLVGQSCQADSQPCLAADFPPNANSGKKSWNGTSYGACQIDSCNYPYKVSANVCIQAQVNPNNGIISFNSVPAANIGIPITSNAVTIQGLDIPVPVSITGGLNAHIEVFSPPMANFTAQGVSYANLKNNDQIRIVTDSSSAPNTAVTVKIDIGGLKGIPFNVTTVSGIIPPNPVLTHNSNENKFTIAWGAGGIGNGGAGGCSVQYLKDGTTWTTIGSGYDCDNALSATTVNLPGDNWTNNFDSAKNPGGVEVRVLRNSTSLELIRFSKKLTCNKIAIMPKNDNPNLDENCDGLWTNDFDAAPPVGGSFIIAGLSNGFTNTLTVNLSVTCPTDQSNAVQVAFANTIVIPVATASDWQDCNSANVVIPFNLTDGDGLKNVYMFSRDAYSNTSGTSMGQNSVTLNKNAPTNGSFIVAGGASRTKSNSVQLTVTCPTSLSGGIEMSYSTSPNPDVWGTVCSTNAVFTLPTVDGNYTIYMRFKDKMGNKTGNISQPILLDSTGPVVNQVSVTTNANWITTLNPTISISVSDAQNSSPFACKIERQEGTSASSLGGYTVLPQTSCNSFTDSLQEGKFYSYRVTATDSLGNVGNSVTLSTPFGVDTTAPILVSSSSFVNVSKSPNCGDIIVSVNVNALSETGSGLHATPISFDSGSSWVPLSSNSKTYTQSNLSLYSGQIKVRDIAGNQFVYLGTDSASSTSCTCPSFNGVTLYNGGSTTGYSIQSATSPTMCGTYSATITCNNGSLSTNNTSYPYSSCTQNYRSCSLPGYGTPLLHGTEVYSYPSSTAACGASLSQNVYFSCSDGNLSSNPGGYTTYYSSYSNLACPINGACNNSMPLGCATGTAYSDGGQTSCGTTHTWYCQGSNNGSSSNQCVYSNSACPVYNPPVISFAQTEVYVARDSQFGGPNAATQLTPVLSGGAMSSCSVSPALPANYLVFNEFTCGIIPNFGLNPQPNLYPLGRFPYKITVTNNGGTSSATVYINIIDTPKITFNNSVSSPTIFSRTGWIQTLSPTITVGTKGQFVCEMASTNPPPGLQLDQSSCALYYTPPPGTPQYSLQGINLIVRSQAGTISSASAYIIIN